MSNTMSEMLKKTAKSRWKRCPDCECVQQKFDVAGPGTPDDPQFNAHTCEKCGGQNLEKCDPPDDTPTFEDDLAPVAGDDFAPVAGVEDDAPKSKATPRKARRQKYAGPFRKPRADVYTVMLLISLLAIIAGAVFLYLEVEQYGNPPFKGGPSVSLPVDRPAVVATATPVVSCPSMPDSLHTPFHG